MGLTPHEYYCMTRAEFFCATNGYQNKEWKKWEHTRVMAYTTANTVMSKKKLPKMTKWMPLPNDAEMNKLSDKHIKSMFDKVAQMDKNKK